MARAATSSDAGFECELAGAEPERPEPRRAAARASATGPVLGYLSHVDTVLADARGLDARPVVAASSHDGFLWGRGALDMKSQTAAEVVAGARAGARRLAAAARRAEGHRGRRRGDRRRCSARSG